MSLTQLKMRTWTGASLSNTELTLVLPGEPFWDPTLSRMGIWNNRNATPEWFPRLLNDFILNESQRLAGHDNTDSLNPLMLDYSTPNTIKIIDTSNSNAVLASFSAAGQVFSSASSLENGISHFVNLLQNSSLLIPRFINDAGTNLSSTTLTRYKMLRPNWFMWKSTGTPGNISCTLDSSDTPFSGVTAYRVLTAGAPTSAGVRLYVWAADSLLGYQMTASVYLKATAGNQTKVRVSSYNSVITPSTTWTASGGWDRVSLTFNVPSSESGHWIAFDVLYNPGSNIAFNGTQTWRVCAPQINLGSVPLKYEARPMSFDTKELRSVYSTGSFWTPATGNIYVPTNELSLPLKGSDAINVEMSNTFGNAMTVSGTPTTAGFVANVGSVYTAGPASYLAYYMPNSAEML